MRGGKLEGSGVGGKGSGIGGKGSWREGERERGELEGEITILTATLSQITVPRYFS